MSEYAEDAARGPTKAQGIIWHPSRFVSISLRVVEYRNKKSIEGVFILEKVGSPYGDRRWFRAACQSVLILLLASFLGIATNYFRTDRIPLIGDWSMKGQLHSKGFGEDLVIPIEEAEVLYFSGQAVFLDARSDDAFSQGRIAGARNLPWVEFENRSGEVLADVPKDSEIITYCDGESCSLSKELALALLGNGYQRVRVLVNGWSLWQQAGLPTESS